MLKSKDSRDTLLLIFMALIIIAFFVYLFLPSKKEEEKTNPGEQKKPLISKGKTPASQIKLPEPAEPTEEIALEEFNQQIETQLDSLWKDISSSDPPFQHYNIENLKNLLLASGNQMVEKLYKFSFFDLNDILALEFPHTYSNSLRFNLYLSFFLIKIQEEYIERAFASLPKVEVEKLVNFEVYQLLDQEIVKDFQLIPILFYFRHLLQGINLFPTEDCTLFFKTGVENLRDLSDSKGLIKIQELLAFSSQNESYRVDWVEEDGIFGNDKKVYKNLFLKIFHFLKQDYLIFPGGGTGKCDQWIEDLCNADSGDIELESLSFRNEDPSRQANVIKIVYAPLNAQFAVLLKEYSPGNSKDILDRMVKRRIEEFLSSFIIIDFTMKEVNPKLFKTELKQFGIILKKNMPKEKSSSKK
jgi:hypothetical protein